MFLEKLLFYVLLDVIKLLFSFNELYLPLLLDYSDCSNCSSLENTPFSNALNTISLPLRSAIALFNTLFEFFLLFSS